MTAANARAPAALHGTPSRIAMLWGQAHVRADGFPRFLPPGDRVLALYAIGARHSPDAPDELLRDRLVLDEPVLVPLGDDGDGGSEAALLLPDAQLGGAVDRVRAHGEAVAPGVRVSATTAGTFKVGGRSVEVGSDGAQVQVPIAGLHTFSFESGGVRVVGSVDVPERGEVELAFDVAERETRLIERGPGFR